VDDAAGPTGPRPRLFLTGGAVAEVLPSLRATGEIVPDLVLRGIARWLESGRV
jgi:pantothenate kinase type III